MRAAVAKRERREALARQEAERREWERIRWQKADEIRKEEERLKGLDQEVDDWHRSHRIRAYIDAVRQQVAASGGEISADSKLGKWVNWAIAHADRLDPLKPSPPSVLDEKQKYGI